MSSSKIFFSWGQQLDHSFYQILWNFIPSFSFFLWHPSTFHFQEIIKNKKEDFVLQNEEASVKYCQVKLDEISKTLMESISAGTFSVPGGYELYRKAKERFEQDYHQVSRKGVKVRTHWAGGVYRIESRGVSWKSESTELGVGNETAWRYHDSFSC